MYRGLIKNFKRYLTSIINKLEGILQQENFKNVEVVTVDSELVQQFSERGEYYEIWPDGLDPYATMKPS